MIEMRDGGIGKFALSKLAHTNQSVAFVLVIHLLSTLNILALRSRNQARNPRQHIFAPESEPLFRKGENGSGAQTPHHERFHKAYRTPDTGPTSFHHLWLSLRDNLSKNGHLQFLRAITIADV